MRHSSIIVAVAAAALALVGAGRLGAQDALPTAPSWDIDVHSYESSARVTHYLELFSGPAKERITERLERGTRYEPMIRQQLHDAGIPEDMYYLAMVESGFDPNAYSKAAAVGMWQFMTTTAKDMGLRVDWWVDERRDPVRSTDAAVRYIRGLRDQFGSLYLAAAAYNGGPVMVARALTRYAKDLAGMTGDDAFFAIASKPLLRPETKEYVPQLIAAALIAKEPARYGMEIHAQTPLAYDSVSVGPLAPLSAIAKASGALLEEIKELNPHLLRGMTPPRDSSIVRVPLGSAGAFDSAFAAMAPELRTGARAVKTKVGETFTSIAKRLGISATTVSHLNPSADRLKSGDLVAGQTILVPTDGVAKGAVAVPDPAIEHYGPSASSATHVVAKGETLGLIAKHAGTTVSVLMELNGLHRELITPGQVLTMPKAKKGA